MAFGVKKSKLLCSREQCWIDMVMRGGSYVFPAGTPYGARALPPGSDKKPYNVYQVKKPFDNVEAGKIAPWFGELGFGTQYKLPKSVGDLVESGHLKRVRCG
jgi:hypothetical protein